MRALLIVALCGAACRDAPPLERLEAPDPVVVDEMKRPPPPPPPPPPPQRAIAAPPDIARLVRDRFGTATVTLRVHASERMIRLSHAQSVELVRRLARDDAFQDGANGCTCGPVDVRIARGDDAVTFVVDCGNVYLGDRHVASLHDDVASYIEALL
jgi:hypothetical protein